MANKKRITNSKKVLTYKTIASAVAESALECYGVVGLADKASLARKIQSILAKEEFTKGVSAFIDRNNVSITLYLVIAKGVKITEVLNEVQKRVSYDVKRQFGVNVKKVDVYAVSVRKID